MQFTESMKEYPHGEIVVVWEPEKCIHSQRCVKGLPLVFDRSRRPWIDMKGAGPEEIMRVIDTCPSGALSYRKSGEKDATGAPPTSSIKVTRDGPLVVEGGCSLMDADGREIRSCGPYVLCRCGRSGKKPFCDGRHVKVGFKDDG